MPIRERTLTEIEDAVRAYMRVQYPDAALGDTRFLGKLVAVISLALLMIEQSIERADRDGSPTPRSSTTALDQWAFIFGLPRTGGGYGRNPATTAGGGISIVQGVAGTVFPIGAVLVADDGKTEVKLDAGVTLPGVAPAPSYATCTFTAVAAGAAGNLPKGTLLRWRTPPPGAVNTVTLTTGLTDGLDTEDDRALLNRLYEHLRTPPKGGAVQDYREWTSAVAGVLHVFVYPRRSASGTVDVVILGPGSGASRSGASLVTAVQGYLLPRLPADMDFERVRVYGGMFLTGLTVRTRVVPTAPNAFDWDDAGTALAIDSYSAGTGAGGADQITFTGPAPASLTAAITAGFRPRLQVLTTGGPTIPVQVRCVAFATVAGPKTKVDLENPLPGGFKPPAPQAGDLVYAGGPAAVIAQAQLDHLDALGPSRASGYADVLHDWDDTLRIAKLIEIAMAAVDDNGRLIENVVFSGTTPQVTINGVVADFQAADSGYQVSPEVLRAAHLVVTG